MNKKSLLILLLIVSPMLLAPKCWHDSFDDPDVTPPQNINDFTVVSVGPPTDLSWTNPPDSDLARAWIRCKTDGYPINHADGTLVYENSNPTPGAPEAITDTSTQPTTTYYYAIFSVDVAEN